MTSFKEQIILVSDGLRLPQATEMYCVGVYFAIDLFNNAQEIYTKGKKKLLLCKVLLGKCLNLKKSDKTKLQQKDYDSVYAPRDTVVQNGEYIVFDPDQNLPMHIINYGYIKVTVLQATPSLSTNKKTWTKFA